VDTGLFNAVFNGYQTYAHYDYSDMELLLQLWKCSKYLDIKLIKLLYTTPDIRRVLSTMVINSDTCN